MLRRTRQLGAALLLVLLLIGVPALLWQTVGDPAAGLRSLMSGHLTDRDVLRVLAAIVYAAAAVAWAQFTVAFVVELASGVRRSPVPRRIPAVFAGQQHFARALVTAVLLLGPTLLSAAGPTMTAVAAGPPAAVSVPTGAHPGSAAPAAATRLAATRPANATVSITTGGPRTWWDLAAHHLGAGDRWRQLWTLNQGRVQTDGTAMASASGALRPGWTIEVPHTDTAVTPDAAAGAPARISAGDVTVVAGDSMSQIAADHGSTTAALWNTNHDRTEPGGQRFTDPDYIEPGWTIQIPPPPAGPAPSAGEVTVAAGDSMSQIAADHGSTTAALWNTNHDRTEPGGQRFTDPDYIEPGWTIQIPHPTPPAQPGAGRNPVSRNGHTHAPDTRAAEQAARRAAAAKTAADRADRQKAAAAKSQAEQTVRRHAAAARHNAEQGSAGTAGADRTAHRDAAPDAAAAPSRADRAITGSTTAGATTTWPTTTALLPVGQSGGQGAAAGGSVEPDTSVAGPQVSMLAAGGGAVLLTALGAAALLRARRRQFRVRRPGRAIAGTPPELAEIERTLLCAGQRGLADMTWLDQALRSLVHGLSAVAGGQLPDVVAVRLGRDELELILATPLSAAAPPWLVDAAGLRWAIRRGDELPYDPALREVHMPPFPLLASVGYTPAGEHYLIDLERVGSLSLTGDRERCLNMARFIAAEVAYNSWSELVEVTMVGFGQEMAQMHPEQLQYTPDPARVLTSLRAHLTGVQDVIGQAEVDVATGRLTGVAGDTWGPRVLLIAPDPNGPVEQNLADLLATLSEHAGRLTVAVVLAGTGPGAAQTTSAEPIEAEPTVAEPTRWQLHIDADGVLTIPALGLQLIAEQLPLSEAAQLAQLLAHAATGPDQPMPAADGDQPWDAVADAAGGLRPEVTTAATAPALRVAGTWPHRPNSILPLPPVEYSAKAATTEQDVAALAPGISDEMRAQIGELDPTLDEDLAAWRDPASDQPKLRLFGPIDVWSAQLDPRPAGRPQKIEAVAYLVTRPRGATAAQTRTDLWPEDRGDRATSKVRNLMLGTRGWLGVNPHTGREYLPPNPGEARGGLYLIEGVLCDVELFRRLRIRAAARGVDGMPDLQAALDLVTGVPFEGRRPRGYHWVLAAALDYRYISAIGDVAHTLATHHLTAGEPEAATAAAQAALTAGSTADDVLLDLVAACHARGDTDGGDTYVKKIMRNYEADTEEDIPVRTYEILLRRGWLPTTHSA